MKITKYKSVAIALALLSGGTGLHWFYLGLPQKASYYLLLSLSGIALYLFYGLPYLNIIMYGIGIIDAVRIRLLSKDDFYFRYCCDV